MKTNNYSVFVICTLLYGQGIGCSYQARCPARVYPSAQAALLAHANDRSRIKTMRAEATVTQVGGRGKVRASVWMLVDRNGRIRFDAMTPFGPALTLTTDGTRFELSDFRNHKFLQGPVCPAAIAHMIGVHISNQAIAHLVFGELPKLDAQSQQLECGKESTYRLTQIRANGDKVVANFAVPNSDMSRSPQEQRLQLSSFEVRDARNTLKWSVEFDEQPRPGTVGVPKIIRIRDYQHNVETRVEFKQIELNVPLDDDPFRQAPAPGLRVEPAPC